MNRILFLAVSICILTSGCNTSAESAYADFLTRETKESYIAVPLCEAGNEIIPILIKNIKEKEMKRRRYAIGFLGVTESELAVPVLERILEDPTEKEFFRGDALESLFLLDKNLGEKAANIYKKKENYLGKMAQEILQVEDFLIYKKNRRELICNPQD